MGGVLGLFGIMFAALSNRPMPFGFGVLNPYFGRRRHVHTR